MVSPAWIGIVAGAFMLLLGLIVVMGRLADIDRHHGQWQVVFGFGAILTGLHRLSGSPEQDWKQWVGIGCILVALLLQWRSYRLTRRATSARRDDAQAASSS